MARHSWFPIPIFLFIWPQTSSPLWIHFRWEVGSAVFLDYVCWVALHCMHYSAFVDGMTNFVHNDFWRCSWTHAVIIWTESYLYFMQCLLEAWRSRASNIDFQLCPVGQRDVSGFSRFRTSLESFDNFMYCRWFNIHYRGTLPSNFSVIRRRSFLQIAEPLPIFTSEKLSS